VVAVEEGETQIKGSDMLCYVMSCYVGGVDQKKQNNLGAKTAHIFDTKKNHFHNWESAGGQLPVIGQLPHTGMTNVDNQIGCAKYQPIPGREVLGPRWDKDPGVGK